MERPGTVKPVTKEGAAGPRGEHLTTPTGHALPAARRATTN